MNFKQISEEFDGATAIEINDALNNTEVECEFYYNYSKRLPRKRKKQWRSEVKRARIDIADIRKTIESQLQQEYRANTMLIFDAMNIHTDRLSNTELKAKRADEFNKAEVTELDANSI